jgi:hypothetical protein
MKSASPDARKATALATSPAVPIRPRGTLRRMASVCGLPAGLASVKEFGGDGAGRDVVDVDIIGCHLQGPGARQSDETGLAGGIDRAIRFAEARPGSDVDDLAVALGFHVGQAMLGAKKSTLEVDARRLVPVVFADRR